MGVWIEMTPLRRVRLGSTSLPAWECGLKSNWKPTGTHGRKVTPCVGVWIEIFMASQELLKEIVTPCVGVWIEIPIISLCTSSMVSLPAWECGLKSCSQILV